MIDAVITDVDGTVAHMKDRGPFDWKKVGSDEPDNSIIELLQILSRSGVEVIAVTGRDEVCREETLEWFKKYGVPVDKLFMRPEGDFRKDTIVKDEILKNEIEGVYRVIAVFEDRKKVVDFWRSRGFKCLQVEDGDF